MQLSLSSSSSVVSAKRRAWRERVILSRASGPVRSPAAYLQKALRQFIRDEATEIGQWLVNRLVEEIDKNHLSIEAMKNFVAQSAGQDELPTTDVLIESVIVIAYFKWKANVLGRSSQNPGCRARSFCIGEKTTPTTQFALPRVDAPRNSTTENHKPFCDGLNLSSQMELMPNFAVPTGNQKFRSDDFGEST